MEKRYYEGFDDWKNVSEQFGKYGSPEQIGDEPEYVFAWYNQDGYEGNAGVIYSYDKENFFIVSGSHCSCYGLEDQWDPTEQSLEVVKRIFKEGNQPFGFYGGVPMAQEWLKQFD